MPGDGNSVLTPCVRTILVWWPGRFSLSLVLLGWRVVLGLLERVGSDWMDLMILIDILVLLV